jgi:hypothetical protein
MQRFIREAAIVSRRRRHSDVTAKHHHGEEFSHLRRFFGALIAGQKRSIN